MNASGPAAQLTLSSSLESTPRRPLAVRSTAQAVRAPATDAVRENLANYALVRRERPRLYSDVPCAVLCWRELVKRGREKFAAE